MGNRTTLQLLKKRAKTRKFLKKRAKSNTSGKTYQELIIMAAKVIFKPSFTIADLVIASWWAFPDAFGMDGYKRKHPNSHKIAAEIHGSRGLIKRGKLIKNKEGYLELPNGNNNGPN